jgi:hypothetical protein
MDNLMEVDMIGNNRNGIGKISIWNDETWGFIYPATALRAATAVWERHLSQQRPL